MPRKPIDYKDALIYKLVCKDLSITDLYVGHTTSFKDRKRDHKSHCINQCSRRIYKTMNNHGGWDNWDMIEIEKYPCADVNEARARERYWYEFFDAKLNTCRPTINIDEMKSYKKTYREANKDKIKAYSEAYNEANKDQIKEYAKAYHEANKDKTGAYYEANKDKIKTYQEANKDKIKAYTEANKDKIKAQQKLYYERNKKLK